MLSSNDPALGVFLQEEKDVINTIKTLVKELHESAVYLAKWGESEFADINDITGHLLSLETAFGDSLLDYAQSHCLYREGLKNIKKLHTSLKDNETKLKKARENLAQAVQLKKPYTQLENDVKSLEFDQMSLIANYESQKRAYLKSSIKTKAEAGARLAKSLHVFSTFQSHMADQIPQGTLSPGQQLPTYIGARTTSQIYSDFKQALKSARGNDFIASEPLTSLKPPDRVITHRYSDAQLHSFYSNTHESLQNKIRLSYAPFHVNYSDGKYIGF